MSTRLLLILLNTGCYCNKQKFDGTTDSSQMEMAKKALLTDIFLITNFYVKIVANTNKNIWEHID